jgi:DNA primase
MTRIIKTLKERLDLVQVVSEHVKLKKTGRSYIGLCPFHSEKTASFHVFEEKGYFRCFGCQTHGDVLDFLVKQRNVTLTELIADLAEKNGLVHPLIAEEKVDPTYFQLEALYQVNAWAQSVFVSDQTRIAETLAALNRPLLAETIHHFGIGFCHENVLSESYLRASQDVHMLKEAGIIKATESGKCYDIFRNRLIFSIKTAKGKIAGFSGRSTAIEKSKSSKYLNSCESSVYQKSKLFFGLEENFTAISGKKEVILVEGAFDVLAVWESGLKHVVATCGTAVTQSHAEKIAKIAEKVVLFFDGDAAGLKATVSAWQLLESYGVFVRVCKLPNGHDPDSWYRNVGEAAFLRYFEENTVDAICWFVQQSAQITDLAEKHKHLLQANEYLQTTPFQHIIVDWRKRLIEQNADFVHVFQGFSANSANSESKSFDFSDTDLNLFAMDGKYYIKVKGKLRCISNFILIPMYYISNNAEKFRVFQVINADGFSVEIRMDGSCWTQLDKFCKVLIDEGNFVFDGTKADMNKLKRKYFGELENAIALDRLGYNHEFRIYAWANGLYHQGKFFPKERNTQLAQIADKIFYLPQLTREQRQFCYHKNSLTVQDVFQGMSSVFAEGSNGTLAILYMFASTFQEVIFEKCKYFPLLFGFGIPSSGKSTIARKLLSFYGHPQKQINLSASTPVGMYRQSAFMYNAIVWMDEYKNGLKPNVIEFLKGLYDGAGNLRGAYTNTNETINLVVSNGIIITGQDLPTHDPALLSRVILMEFNKKHFSEQERKVFSGFEKAIGYGIGHLISELSDETDFITTQFVDAHTRAIALLEKEAQSNKDLENNTRIIANYAVLLAIGLLVRLKFELPTQFEDLMRKAVLSAMIRHLELQGGNDDIAQFWEIFERLVEIGELRTGDHFKVLTSENITIEGKDGVHSVIASQDDPILLLRLKSTSFAYTQHYRKLHMREGLGSQTLTSYLFATEACIGTVKSHRFGDKNTSAHAFRLKSLDITLPDSAM